MILELEFIKVQSELHDTKIELAQFTQKQKEDKILKILNKIKCHTNEQLKLMRFSTKLQIQQLQLGNRQGSFYHEKIISSWYKELNKITD